MSLLRVLIPSWKFFDQPGSLARLTYQTSLDLKLWSPWIEPARPSADRGMRRLFLNEHENAWLAKSALVDQLCAAFFEQDAKELPELSESLDYRLVENWVVMESRSTDPKAPYLRFQIEITDLDSASALKTLSSAILKVRRF